MAEPSYRSRKSLDEDLSVHIFTVSATMMGAASLALVFGINFL